MNFFHQVISESKNSVQKYRSDNVSVPNREESKEISEAETDDEVWDELDWSHDEDQVQTIAGSLLFLSGYISDHLQEPDQERLRNRILSLAKNYVKTRMEGNFPQFSVKISRGEIMHNLPAGFDRYIGEVHGPLDCGFILDSISPIGDVLDLKISWDVHSHAKGDCVYETGDRREPDLEDLQARISLLEQRENRKNCCVVL